MKTILTYLCFLTALHTSALSQSEKLDCNELRAAIAMAKKSINDYKADKSRETHSSYELSEIGIVESSMTGFEKNKEFRIIQEYIKAYKEQCVSCFGSTVQDPVEMALFFKAAQVLSLEEYIKFATAAADLVPSEVISKKQYEWVLFPFSKHLRDIWAEDPISKPLQQLALRAKAVMQDDVAFSNFLDEILSRDLASVGAPRQTIPPIADGSVPLSTVIKEQLRYKKNKLLRSLEKQKISTSMLWGIIVTTTFIITGLFWFFLKKR
jgi:hypothetical protein